MDGAAEQEVTKLAVKGADKFLEGEVVKQSMDTTKRGGVMGNFCCFVLISDKIIRFMKSFSCCHRMAIRRIHQYLDNLELLLPIFSISNLFGQKAM